MKLFLRWLVLAVSVWIAAMMVPGFEVDGFASALWVAIVFGLLNLLIGWLIFIAIGIGTFGLGFIFAMFTQLIVNTIVLKLADGVTSSLTINGWGTAFLAALLITVVSGLLHFVLGTKRARHA